MSHRGADGSGPVAAPRTETPADGSGPVSAPRTGTPADGSGPVAAWRTGTATAARPIRRLGAASAGGLALPDAAPTPGTMYAPRGVWTDGRRVVVADTGNHRVLVWHDWPASDGAAADVVLGQPDMTCEGPAAGGSDPVRGLHLPTGVAVLQGRLVVADAWHHRLVAWDGLPERDFAAPSWVLGQAAPNAVTANRGGDPDLASFYWPFGFGVAAGAFWVADTGNRRVLGWLGEQLPDPGRPADVLLGQARPGDRDDNAGGLGPATFRWPHAVARRGAAGEDGLLVADAGNHRVLGWCARPSGSDVPADLVLGQPAFDVAEEFKSRPQGPARLRFPYAVASDEDRVVVADTSNNRVLLWHRTVPPGAGTPADTVLAQPDADANGENRWAAVTDDSLCWPYGLSLAGDLLAVADSGNNRVVLWTID